MRFNPDKIEVFLVDWTSNPGIVMQLVWDGIRLTMKNQVHSLGMLLDLALIQDDQVAEFAQFKLICQWCLFCGRETWGCIHLTFI